MPQSKYTSSIPGSDESWYRLINCSSINHNLERTMLQDTIGTALDKKSNTDSRSIIRLEIIFNLVLISLAILVQFTSSNQVSDSKAELQGVEINQQLIDNK